eukprot:3391005-Amphidinium_carterae.1
MERAGRVVGTTSQFHVDKRNVQFYLNFKPLGSRAWLLGTVSLPARTRYLVTVEGLYPRHPIVGEKGKRPSFQGGDRFVGICKMSTTAPLCTSKMLMKTTWMTKVTPEKTVMISMCKCRPCTRRPSEAQQVQPSGNGSEAFLDVINLTYSGNYFRSSAKPKWPVAGKPSPVGPRCSLKFEGH